MPDDDVLDSVQFRCAKNGCACVHGFESARRFLWAANLGCVKPLGWQHVRLGDYDDAYFFEEQQIGPALIDSLIKLYSTQCTPVTAGSSFHVHKRRRRVKPNNLNQRYLRLRKKFPADHDPIIIMPDYENHAGARNGYMFARGLKYFIIHGLVIPDPRFDWRLFLQPPVQTTTAAQVMAG